MKMQGEMERLTKALDRLGIDHQEHEGGMVTFPNGSGDCYVFPSQTYDGKLFVRYSAETRVETATDVLIACGVIGDGVE